MSPTCIPTFKKTLHTICQFRHKESQTAAIRTTGARLARFLCVSLMSTIKSTRHQYFSAGTRKASTSPFYELHRGVLFCKAVTLIKCDFRKVKNQKPGVLVNYTFRDGLPSTTLALVYLVVL
ncbi:hypothetical protein AMECASPLE_006496 [Ameca splendens]|uniref:Uncharacterized protein n=1 Tax=Ameca splendens TaxID=208324 RepID=A0ABV0Z860_9TELE